MMLKLITIAFASLATCQFNQVGWQQQLNNAGGAQVILEVFSPILQEALNGSRDASNAMNNAISYWTASGGASPANISLTNLPEMTGFIPPAGSKP